LIISEELMNDATDADPTATQPAAHRAAAFPNMLPRGGALAGAPDSQEQLVRAISRYLAIEALKKRDFGGVSAFRQRELGGAVLSPGEVKGWIVRELKPPRVRPVESRPSWWLSGVALDEGDFEQHEDGTISIHKRLHVQWKDDGLPAGPQSAHEEPTMSRRELQYWWLLPKPGGWGEPFVGKDKVREGTTLDRLRRLSQALAEEFQWEPAQATTFVLTGLVPYSEVWNRNLEAVRVRGRRPRELSLKHLELALFTAERESEPLAARMKEWNAQHPEWEYAQVTNFGRDSRDAVRRLEERLDLAAKGDE
jgi:hypothetical protein